MIERHAGTALENGRTMADAPFSMTAGEIASLVGGRVVGDPSREVWGANSLDEAREGELCFARSPKYYPQLRETRASVVLVAEPVEGVAATCVVVKNPEGAFLRVLRHFLDRTAPSPEPSGVHPAAWVHPEAVLEAGVSVGPFACVESGARIGQGTRLGAGVYVGPGARVGRECVLYPNVVVRDGVVIGDRCVLHPGACIGGDGFGFVPFEGHWEKVPQAGTVLIGDDVEIGCNSAVDRATFGATRVGAGTKIDNLVQIGHNVEIGEHCVIAGMVGISGSVKIGNHVRIGAAAGIAGHITIGDGASIGARSGVAHSVPAGGAVSGFPAVEHALSRRIMVSQARLPELLRRVRDIERRLGMG